MTKNERKTENLVRSALQALSYYAEDNTIAVEEQKSNVDAIKRLLKGASKSGKGGHGAPEFFIHNHENPDILVVIECKASTKDHVSPVIAALLAGEETGETIEEQAKRVQRYAVDGVFHYARQLSKEFHVIALAVSGETKSAMRVSTYLYAKGAQAPSELRTKDGKEIDSIIGWSDYVMHSTYDPTVQRLRVEELMSFAEELHEFMRDHAKLTESEKPLLVSGTLIALRNKAFTASYNAHTPESLQREWMKVIRDEIRSADIPEAKKDNMVQPYSSIAVHPELGKATEKFPKGVLHRLIELLDQKVWPFISIYDDFDVVGKFYGEFLKYTGGDKKALGIVLTPRHITELFALLANVNKSSKVLDICAGTCGFLVSAMHRMLKDAITDKERKAIKSHGLVGVEQQPNMFALAASNMILRGDGKANLYQGSCFDAAITTAIKAHKCSTGMLNPPFAQSDASLHELYFTKHMLDCLAKGGTGIAVVPMSCALSSHPAKAELMKQHTLEAVMTMPDELFYPVGVITCIMIFTAKIPHATSNRKTWFGYWKNDGFAKTKNKGRVDLHGRWSDIRDRWVEMYLNREVHPGESVMQKVSASDEWCAEAYIDTDYSVVPSQDFASVVRDYVAFKLSKAGKVESADLEPDKSGWKPFRFEELFQLKKGKRLTKANQTDGDTPFIGAIDSNNGVAGYVGQKSIHAGGTITVNYNGAGVADAFYQPVSFWASDDVNVLYPLFKMTPAVALFIATIIRKEKYRFSYGRKWHLERMKTSVIHLPVTASGTPDWAFMEGYIASLPYGVQVGS